jgi:hypothetical protein
MPTVARRPVAQQERERIQVQRLRAAKLFAIGVRQADRLPARRLPPGRKPLVSPLAGRRHGRVVQPRPDRARLNIELADLPAAVEHVVGLSALPAAWPNMTLDEKRQAPSSPVGG